GPDGQGPDSPRQIVYWQGAMRAGTARLPAVARREPLRFPCGVVSDGEVVRGLGVEPGVHLGPAVAQVAADLVHVRADAPVLPLVERLDRHPEVLGDFRRGGQGAASVGVGSGVGRAGGKARHRAPFSVSDNCVDNTATPWVEKSRVGSRRLQKFPLVSTGGNTVRAN